MSRLTRSIPSRWKRIWFLLGASTRSTGSSTSARILAELVERPGRHDDARLLDRVEGRDRLDRDPVVVGGGQGQLVALESAQDAGQDRAGPRRWPPRRSSRSAPGGGPAGGCGWSGRSPAIGIAGNSSASMPLTWVSNRPARIRSVSPAWSSRSTRSPAGRPATMSARSLAGTVIAPSESIRAGDPVGDPDLEVGGGQLEPRVLGLDEDVAEDRQGAPGGDGPAHDREAAGEVLLHDRYVHVGLHSKEPGSRDGRGTAVNPR